MAQPACTTTCCDPAASRFCLALFILGNCIMSTVGLSAVPSLLQMTDSVMAFVFHGLHTKHCSVAQLAIILFTPSWRCSPHCLSSFSFLYFMQGLPWSELKVPSCDWIAVPLAGHCTAKIVWRSKYAFSQQRNGSRRDVEMRLSLLEPA